MIKLILKWGQSKGLGHLCPNMMDAIGILNNIMNFIVYLRFSHRLPLLDESFKSNQAYSMSFERGRQQNLGIDY